jgi:hypothetical protein
VTGSAIAIPLLGAAGASAAPASTWDRVAECESGGMWSADLGNGYYGGLQLSQETWDAFGGGEYANSPALASRSQQIAIAEKVLDAQGPGAWPSCSSISGLKVGGVAPRVNPGAAPGTAGAGRSAVTGDGSHTGGDAVSGGGSVNGGQDSGVTDSSGVNAGGGTGETGDAGGSTGTGADNGAQDAPDVSAPPVRPTAPAPGSPTDTGPAAGTTASPEASPDGADTAQGKHRGGTSAEAGTAGPEDLRESGRHASRGDMSERQAGVGSVADGDYTVRAGDCLSLIADEHKVSGGWRALYETNQDTVGSDPDLILPGQSLDLSMK